MSEENEKIVEEIIRKDDFFMGKKTPNTLKVFIVLALDAKDLSIKELTDQRDKAQEIANGYHASWRKEVETLTQERDALKVEVIKLRSREYPNECKHTKTFEKLEARLSLMRKIIVDSANSIDELKVESDWENGEAIAYDVKKYVVSEILKSIDSKALSSVAVEPNKQSTGGGLHGINPFLTSRKKPAGAVEQKEKL